MLILVMQKQRGNLRGACVASAEYLIAPISTIACSHSSAQHGFRPSYPGLLQHPKAFLRWVADMLKTHTHADTHAWHRTWRM